MQQRRWRRVLWWLPLRATPTWHYYRFIGAPDMLVLERCGVGLEHVRTRFRPRAAQSAWLPSAIGHSGRNCECWPDRVSAVIRRAG